MNRILTSFVEGIRIAVVVLADNRIRSALTILGVGVGVSVVVAFGALLNGVRGSIGELVQSAGTDNLFVSRVDFSEVSLTDINNLQALVRGRPRLTARDATLLSRVDGVDEAFLSLEFRINVGLGSDRIENVPARGFDAGWPRFNEGDFVAGRDFTDAEVREAVRVIVLSSGLAEELFGAQDPIGRSVRLTSTLRTIRQEFRVVGVFDPAPNIFSGVLSNWAAMPHSAATKYLRERGERSNVIVVPDPEAELESVQDALISALRADRGLGPRDENNFAVSASSQLVEAVDELFGVLFLVVVGLSSAGLMVGGVGVIGIMLISVTERTREIGVRKAIGATRREILWQFLVESGLLTTLGGVAGLLMGFGFATVVGALTPLEASIPLWSIGVALLGAAITGIVFGLIPAYRAARLLPVEALRAE
jgi:putative ABC transport system permease protein